MRKLNFGSSSARVEGWLNVDLQPGENVDIVANVKYLYIPWGELVDAIRASHLLEHLYPSEVPWVLRTWFECLKPGGQLIIGVPDFDYVVQRYLEVPKDYLHFWGKNFNGFIFTQLYGVFFGHPTEGGNEPFRHHVVFNEDSLTQLLEHAGFVDIQRCRPASMKENEGFDDSMLRPSSLNIKSRKPQSSGLQEWLRPEFRATRE